MESKKILNLRILAFIIDLLIICCIQSIGFFYIILTNLDFNTMQINNLEKLIPNLIMITIISTMILIVKDIIKGQSIGKKILKIKIVDLKSDKSPNFLKLIIRNLFILVWPIEFLVLINDKKHHRLGDKILGTKIIN